MLKRTYNRPPGEFAEKEFTDVAAGNTIRKEEFPKAIWKKSLRS